jgi:hypothetical protein
VGQPRRACQLLSVCACSVEQRCSASGRARSGAARGAEAPDRVREERKKNRSLGSWPHMSVKKAWGKRWWAEARPVLGWSGPARKVKEKGRGLKVVS